MGLRYRDAGVDRRAAAEAIRRIGALARATHGPDVVAGVGPFAAACALPAGGSAPVLVAATDGVGTKLELARKLGVHDTVGIDLVAMCVNDVLTAGALPLLFLDYLAMGQLDPSLAETIVGGVARGCAEAGCALIGGETAELPGMLAHDQYELAGFALGWAERAALLGPERTTAGDVLVAVGSSGLHANGYALVRAVLREHPAIDLAAPWSANGEPLGVALLRPTRIYARALSVLRQSCGPGLHAVAHVTGGGIGDNVPRAMAPGLVAHVRLDSYQRPPIFDWLQRAGELPEDELWGVFNLGVGLVAIVAAAQATTACAALRDAGEDAWLLGELRAGPPAAAPSVQRD